MRPRPPPLHRQHGCVPRRGVRLLCGALTGTTASCLLWWCLRNYGIVGAAIAWTIRVAIDTMLWYYFSSKHLNLFKHVSVVWILLFVTYLLLVLLGTTLDNFLHRTVFLLVILPIIILFIWFVLVDGELKTTILQGLRAKVDSFLKLGRES